MSLIQNQRGVSMIESLVAILVLAIGVMGLAGLQTRSLVETRLTNARANALLLANDLAERMRLNRDQALRTDAANPYFLTFGQNIPSPQSCVNNLCNPEQLAQFDRWEWSSSLRQLLPGGEAQVATVAGSTGQLRVTFRWRNNVASTSDTQTAQLMSPLTVDIDGCRSDGDQRDWICHQVFIRP